MNKRSIIILCDLNKDVKVAGRELDKFEEFCDLFNFTNLIKSGTCCAIDLIWINKSKTFQNTFITETGLSDFHKLIFTLFRIQTTRLKPGRIYQNYKYFQDKKESCSINVNYCILWIFASSKSLTKTENLHQRALRFMLGDYSSSCGRIFEKSVKYSMGVKRKQTLHWDINC